MPLLHQTLSCRPLIAAGLALLFAMPAQAGETADPSVTDRPDRLVMIGIGPRMKPSFPGSDRTDFGPAPVVNVWREDEQFPVESPDEGKSIKLIGARGSASAGLAIAMAPTRGREADTQGLRKVGFGMEAGLYAEGYVLPNLRLRGELRHGIGSHAAATGDVALDLVLRSESNERALVTIGPRLRLGSGKYNRRFFGISAAEAAASGLPQYRAKAGIHAVGVMAGAYYPLGDSWGLFGSAGYDRLTGDAADSPLVRQRGSRNQVSAGLALTYVFRVRR